MTWNYRIMRYPGGTLGIHEVYYNDSGEVESWTKDAVGICADDLPGLYRTLKRIWDDLDRNPEVLDCNSREVDEVIVEKEQ